MNLPFEIIASTLISECYARRNTIFVIFAFISLTFLAIGTVWPKKYVAFSIVHVEESNILQSLMQGTAETTQAMDHASNAREIIYGERIMDKILEDAEWLEDGQTEFDVETIKQEIKKRTSIRIVGDNLLRIEYQDSDRMRAYVTANRMAELFISEGASSKSLESKNAFEFIDKQVKSIIPI